jgi:hypothetical protein
MAKRYSRKDFIKLGSFVGAAIFLTSCEDSEETQATEKTGGIRLDKHIDSAVVPKAEEKQKTTFELIRNGDLKYETLRKGYNTRINKYPLVIVLCKTTQDVADAILYARKNKLPIAVKSGGHSMEGFSVNDKGMVINLSQMNDVEFLEDTKIKTGPGCTLAHLYDEILPKKLFIPAGSCGTVGLGGLTLGGGYGLFSRTYGLTCDSLVEATMVDGNGVIRSTKDDAELLWALRGGGVGNFGVVTELFYKAHVMPDKLHAHYFKAKKVNAERAKAILEKWFVFAEQLPRACFAAFVLNGQTLNILVTNHGRHTEDLQNLLNNLALEVDEFYSGNPHPLSYMLKNYYGNPVPGNFKNSSAGFYKGFEDISACILEILEKTIQTPGMMYQVNTLGGKIANASFEAVSCYPHRAYNFLSELQGYWKLPEEKEAIVRVSEEILTIIQENGITAQYINYCSLNFIDWETAYYGENYSRLQDVKKKYDADNVICHPQSIKI